MTHPCEFESRLRGLAAVGLLVAAASPHAAPATSAADIAASYAAQVGVPTEPSRGQRFFNTVHSRDWSCASCHGAVPTQAGRHAATGKPIAALAPAFNPDRFTDPAKVDKWFRRNCNDVLGRECTTAEKADVLGWLLSLKP